MAAMLGPVVGQSVVQATGDGVGDPVGEDVTVVVPPSAPAIVTLQAVRRGSVLVDSH